MTFEWRPIGPTLPRAPLPDGLGGEVQTYVPQPTEYRLTTGLLAANPIYRNFFSPTGIVEIVGVSVLTHASLRLSMPIIHSALFAFGVHGATSLFLFSNLCLSAVLSGIMTIINGETEGHRLSCWFVGLCHNLPSSLLGMGLLHRYRFGRSLLQDLALEPGQAALNVGIGKGLESLELTPRSELTGWQRYQVELLEGLPLMFAGRQVGRLVEGGLKVVSCRAVSALPESNFTVRGLAGPDLRSLALMASDPGGGARSPIRREELFGLLQRLRDPRSAEQLEAARQLAQVAREFPAHGEAIRRVLIERLGVAPDPAVREELTRLVRERFPVAAPADAPLAPPPPPPSVPELQPAVPPSPTPKSRVFRRRTPQPTELGGMFLKARAAMGLTQDQLARRAKVSGATIWKLEKGFFKKTSLRSIYRLGAVLRRRLDLPHLYRLYNPEVAELAGFREGGYRMKMPAGASLDEVLSTPLASYLHRRMDELQMTPIQLSRRSGVRMPVLEHILLGGVYTPNLRTIRGLARVLGEPIDLLYLRVHKEIADFVPLADAKSGRVFHRPSGRFDYERLHRAQRPAEEGVAGAFMVLRHARSRGVREASRSLVQEDPRTGDLFIEIPDSWTEPRIEALDLSTHLDARCAQIGETRERLLARFRLRESLFYELLRGRVPSGAVLSRLSKALFIPESVLAVKLSLDLATEIEVRRVPAQVGVDPLSRIRSPLATHIASIEWKRLTPATADRAFRKALRLLRDGTPKSLKAALNEELGLTDTALERVIGRNWALPLASIEPVAQRLKISNGRAYLLARARAIGPHARIDFEDESVIVATRGHAEGDILNLARDLPRYLRERMRGEGVADAAPRFGMDRKLLEKLLRGPFDPHHYLRGTIAKVERALGRPGQLWVSTNREELQQFGVHLRLA